MLAISMLQWWYSQGWKNTSTKLTNRLKNAADFFSIRLLVGNLFAPFRQISAGGEASTPDMWLSVFFDKLLSRVIGAFIRIFLLIVGIVTIILQAIWGVFLVIIWPLLPLAVVGCLFLALIQVKF